MKAEKNIPQHVEKYSQVGRGYPESKPVEAATSVTDDPSGNEGEEPSPACEAGTGNSTKRSPRQRRCGSKREGKVEAPAFRLREEVTQCSFKTQHF